MQTRVVPTSPAPDEWEGSVYSRYFQRVLAFTRAFTAPLSSTVVTGTAFPNRGAKRCSLRLVGFVWDTNPGHVLSMFALRLCAQCGASRPAQASSSAGLRPSTGGGPACSKGTAWRGLARCAPFTLAAALPPPLLPASCAARNLRREPPQGTSAGNFRQGTAGDRQAKLRTVVFALCIVIFSADFPALCPTVVFKACSGYSSRLRFLSPTDSLAR